MAYSLSQSTVPALTCALNALSVLLDKAEAHAAEMKMDVTNLYNSRLIADMLPFSFQVHMVTDTTQKTCARLQGVEPQKWENNLTTTEEMRARIAKALETVKSADRAKIDSYVETNVTLGLGPGKNIELPGSGYVKAYSLPNIFFHLSTAYNILRMNGVQLGKPDLLKPFMGEYMSQAA